MENLEKQNLIIKKLINDGWSINTVSYSGRCPVEARKKYAEIVITTEECECHGGRLWVSDEHTNQHYQISHAEYDKDKGIIDSDTELRYMIENEMMGYVNRYSTFIYKLVEINEFGQDKSGIDAERVTYYSDIKSITRAVVSNDAEDYNIIEKETNTFPNENIKEIVTRIVKESKYSWHKNRVWFNVLRLERKEKHLEFEEGRSYELYIEIFNK
jgi:hypothetical protein